MQPPQAKSVTHEHLLSIINTEARGETDGSLRLLDVGLIYPAHGPPRVEEADPARSAAHLPPRFRYRRSRVLAVDFVSVMILRYVAAVTLFLEKRKGVPHDIARQRQAVG